MVSDPEGESAPTEPKRVKDDTGEGGTGAATTEPVGVPADLPRRAEAPPRGVLVITDREVFVSQYTYAQGADQFVGHMGAQRRGCMAPDT